MSIPTLKYLARSQEEVKSLAEFLSSGIHRDSIIGHSQCEIGGGSGPGTEVPSHRVGIKVEDPDGFAKRLRLSHPGVIGRIEKGMVWLDPRTAELDEVKQAIEVVNRCLS